MRILGIDPGVKHIGIAIYNTKLDNIIHFEEIKTISLYEHYDWFNSFCQNQAIDEVAIEKPFFTTATLGNNIMTLELIGIEKLVCEYFGYPYSMYPPATIKKQFTGSGKATKEDIKETVEKNYNLYLKSSHINDAIAVAVTHYRLLN